MKETRLNNRWWVVLGAVLLQLCVGAIYTWSLFNQPLMDKYGWGNNEVFTTYSIAVFVFAFSTIFSGRLQDKHGPKLVATIGGVLYGGGIVLASTATSLWQLYVYYGVIAGTGVGFVYVCPLSTCAKWFPEKKGFITGIAVGAFGLGSIVFKQLIEFLIVNSGVSEAFLYLGIIYCTLIVFGAQFMKLPKENHRPQSNDATSTDYSVQEMLSTKTFYLMWLMFLFGAMSGLLVIGLAKDIGVGLADLQPTAAANSVALIALFNASGRLFWGALSDKFDEAKVLFSMFGLTAAAMVFMSFASLTLATFFVAVATIAFCFGGFLAVFPVITGKFYGLRNFGANYGVVYQAYGLAALLGPFIVAGAGGLIPTFMIASVLAAIGAVMSLVLKAPV